MDTTPWYKAKQLYFNLIMTIVLGVPVIATAYKALDPKEAILIDSVAGLVTGIGNVLIQVWFPDKPIDTAKLRAQLAATKDTA